MRLPFHQVDVFTAERFCGNPRAVFRDADDLAGETMQRIAREMNLSETTFVQSTSEGGCTFRVRIFTPGQELPFAGHPTIGTAYVLHREGLLPASTFSFAEGTGPVSLRRGNNGRFWMRPPTPVAGPPTPNPGAIATAFAIPAQAICRAPRVIASGGPSFFCLQVNTVNTVDAVELDRAKLCTATSDAVGNGDVLIFSQNSGTAYSRMFAATASNIGEDPATGSSVAPLCLALFLNGSLEGTALTVQQGVKMGRPSSLHARFQHGSDGIDDIEVGGNCVDVFSSSLEL
ncbi:MAG: phenazine biosynthesis protein PhzF [Vulcanimicrobiaceae bacterium]